MPSVIRVRDVIRDRVHELGPEERMLRGPYDLFQPTGSVHVINDGLVQWLQDGVARSGRVAPGPLGDAHPGERVLLRVRPLTSEDEWWVCDVEAVDGVDAD